MTTQEHILNAIASGRIVCKTSTGEVFTLKNGKKRKLKPETTSNGYERVSILYRGARKTATVHQILWIYQNMRTYNGRENCIDHKDGNKKNNSISNIRLVSYKENAKGRRRTPKLNKWKLHSIARMRESGHSFESIAYVFNITINTARNAYKRHVLKN